LRVAAFLLAIAGGSVRARVFASISVNATAAAAQGDGALGAYQAGVYQACGGARDRATAW
jgi:hypothetical protein